MKAHNPPHPGEVLRGLWLEAPVKAAAEGLGVSREALSELVNGHTGISRDMAIRLAKAFPSTSIRLWLDLQFRYDTGRPEQRAASIDVRPFSVPEPVRCPSRTVPSEQHSREWMRATV
jgi:addiction module HigA family antidote